MHSRVFTQEITQVCQKLQGTRKYLVKSNAVSRNKKKQTTSGSLSVAELKIDLTELANLLMCLYSTLRSGIYTYNIRVEILS